MMLPEAFDSGDIDFVLVCALSGGYRRDAQEPLVLHFGSAFDSRDEVSALLSLSPEP